MSCEGSSARLAARLQSEDPAMVADALEELDQAWRQRLNISVAMPPVECLSSFGREVPVDILAKFLRVVDLYPFFEPPPSPDERHLTRVEAVLRYGEEDESLVFDVALSLRSDEAAAEATKSAMRYLASRPLTEPRSRAVAESLLRFLSDAPSTYRAVVDGLIYWRFIDAHPDLIHAMTPHLDPDDRPGLVE